MSLIGNWIESLSYEQEISDACTRRISNMGSCTACIDECPADAIHLDNGKININGKLCTTCGVCITVCPVQAIKGQSPARKVIQHYLFLQDDSTWPTMVELLYYHKKGIRIIHKPLFSEDLMERVDLANELLNKMNSEPMILVNNVVLEKEEQTKISRRALFTKLAYDSKKTILTSMTPIKWRFNERSFQIPGFYKDWSFYEVKMNLEDCTLCEACFKICPSDVFNLDGDSLKLTDHNCSGCRLCIDICKENSIEIMQNFHRSAEISYKVVKNYCNKCKIDFYSWTESEECKICSRTEKPAFFL
ncbi:indolepyruvate ferredoxin oxidoreductase subunit alpha [Mesobacillus jeotgali]|uniref:indolepyruvate ferredoxin oxidoreductase subunit alpha n=1 Tax=Mesobacillus jeotgali TaxID=129985 RepID=UPI0009A5EF89|nr:4Fe-4S dicluster domain-containing protein [Mesobacillus jeotgali]